MAHQSFFRNVFGWLVRHTADLLQFGWPFALFETFNWVFDKGFFPYALWFWGPILGAIIPTVLVFIINAFVFWLYDHMKVDWLKAHALRQLADTENKTKLQKALTWHHASRTTLREKLIGSVRFVLLLTVVDPVIIAIYYRDTHFTGVGKRDWFLLLGATMVAVGIWLLVLEPAVLGAKLLLHMFF